jgi:pantothenate kinase
VILGLADGTGTGKSTLAAALHATFPEESVVVPMDGYHLANTELARQGRTSRKGAADTVDRAGSVALLRRLRKPQAGELVYAPEYRREIEEGITGAVGVLPDVRLVITEGNHLLLPMGHWAEVAATDEPIAQLVDLHKVRAQHTFHW